MAEESDGIEEALDGQLRVLVTAAGRLGEILARAPEEAARRAQTASEQEARELSSRLEAERRAAHTEYGNVYRNDWWDKATPEQIANTYRTARAWSNEDPEAVRAETRMRDELSTRYGIDVNNTGADPAAVREALDVHLKHDRDAGAERQRSSAEEAEAARLLFEADEADRAAEAARGAAEHGPDLEERRQAQEEAEVQRARVESARADAQPLYDSADRRQATAADLESKSLSPEAISAKMRADVSQAKPATEAAKGGQEKSAKARRTRGRAAQAQRSEASR